ncbi:hypothetical protein LNN31_08350 [Acetobacterium wieringae]|uniref:Flp pilus-assembly TadG-like N-terminal domain-containing protein n=1 Tax=Acetobacterium wieringae TaxID=52694 RepID=A0ABY6HKL6_9FIRM|nr:hypothetical protein [Acetobacterium wieringae]UYO64419.1 hypothetical protein LNN31_08350 [Acetobacterium wieringae]VUZ25205.1 Uncharacterised protein [Acetobacterium wieringae]
MKVKTDPGSMTPYVIVFVLVFMMVMAAVWEYQRIYSVLAQVDQSVISAVEGVAQENWDEIYQGVREGYAGAYTKDKLIDNWKEMECYHKSAVPNCKEMR